MRLFLTTVKFGSGMILKRISKRVLFVIVASRACWYFRDSPQDFRREKRVLGRRELEKAGRQSAETELLTKAAQPFNVSAPVPPVLQADHIPRKLHIPTV